MTYLPRPKLVTCWLGCCIFNHSLHPCFDIRSQSLSLSLGLHCPLRKHSWSGFCERYAHDLVVFVQVNQHSIPTPQIKAEMIKIIDSKKHTAQNRAGLA